MSAPEQATIGSHEILLVWENWAQLGEGASCSASSTSPTTGEPLVDHLAEHTLVPDLDLAWRSDSIDAMVSKFGISQVYLDYALGQARQVDWVSIHRHNIRVPWRAHLYRESPSLGAPPVASSAWTDPIIRASLADYDWLDLAWTLGPSDRKLTSLASLFRLDSFLTFEPTYGVTHVRIYFDISGGVNGLADYLQLAYPMIGRAYRPSINMVNDHNLGLTDRTRAQRTMGGSWRGRRESSGARFAFGLPYLGLADSGKAARAEAFERIWVSFLREKGTLGLVFCWPEPSFRRHFHDTAFLGTATELPSLGVAFDVASARGWVIEETE